MLSWVTTHSRQSMILAWIFLLQKLEGLKYTFLTLQKCVVQDEQDFSPLSSLPASPAVGGVWFFCRYICRGPSIQILGWEAWGVCCRNRSIHSADMICWSYAVVLGLTAVVASWLWWFPVWNSHVVALKGQLPDCKTVEETATTLAAPLWGVALEVVPESSAWILFLQTSWQVCKPPNTLA